LGGMRFCHSCLLSGGEPYDSGLICHICRQRGADRVLGATEYRGHQSNVSHRYFRVHDSCARNWCGPNKWSFRILKLSEIGL
jgi:hypothetical protein